MASRRRAASRLDLAVLSARWKAAARDADAAAAALRNLGEAMQIAGVTLRDFPTCNPVPRTAPSSVTTAQAAQEA